MQGKSQLSFFQKFLGQACPRHLTPIFPQSIITTTVEFVLTQSLTTIIIIIIAIATILCTFTHPPLSSLQNRSNSFWIPINDENSIVIATTIITTIIVNTIQAINLTLYYEQLS